MQPSGDRRKSDARLALFERLIDDAGLFPPASLSMEAAVDAHRRSRRGRGGWMLGRFVCPASRLGELARALPEPGDEEPWEVSVVLDAAGESWQAGLSESLRGVEPFLDSVGENAAVASIESRPPMDGLGGIGEALVEAIPPLVEAVEAAGLRDPVVPFLEIPMDEEWERSLPYALEAVATARESLTGRDGDCRPPAAKIRCGGERAAAFPSPDQVALFIAECRRFRVPFKATAGLHHPFRQVDEATGFVQHGFVNLLAAAVLSDAHELTLQTLTDIIAARDADEFSITSEAFGWRDHRTGPAAIARARRNLFVSYGSCSFDEPVGDLAALGTLPPAP
ncbi:MAG: hypothetical protein H0W27_04880 [Actinobacteria bacterium]|nr:hypothetical protein [Actinomycetota bacterium]